MKWSVLSVFAALCAVCFSGCVMKHEPAPLRRSIEVGEVIAAQNRNVEPPVQSDGNEADSQPR